MAATTAKVATPVPANPDYGLDAPKTVRTMFIRGTTILLLGIGMWYMNRAENPRGGTALFFALTAISIAFFAAGGVMVWSSKTAKVAMRERILDSLEWRGDEKVLDVGCGRGLMLIGAAKRLGKSGKATGVDVWSTVDLSGNSGEAAMANAKVEGVSDRVRVETNDARRLPYQNAAFDVVVSSLAIHNIPDALERAKALDEMLRVTKPGGHIVVWDIFHYDEYLRHLTNAGVEIVRQSGLSLLWCVPGKWFVARKTR
jgi:SAM-dependent methyltransferase